MRDKEESILSWSWIFRDKYGEEFTPEYVIILCKIISLIIISKKEIEIENTI